MDHPVGRPSTRLERAAVRAFWLIEIVVLAWCMVLQPRPVSLLAPLLGPWAGHLYGHQECTLARVAPLLAWGSAAVLAAAGAARVLVRNGSLRLPVALLWVVSSLFWSGLAMLSVLNTSS